MSLDIKYSLKY